jgi:hypothetical protein
MATRHKSCGQTDKGSLWAEPLINFGPNRRSLRGDAERIIKGDMFPPLLIVLSAAFGSLAGTFFWHLVSGPVPDWVTFEVLFVGSLIYTLMGAAILVVIQIFSLKRGFPRLMIGTTIIITGGLLGAFLLDISFGSLICLGEPCDNSYLIGALYGLMTALPLLFIRPSLGPSPAAAR